MNSQLITLLSERVDPLDLPAVLRVVVDEHVLGGDERLVGVEVEGGRDGHLEAPHVPRVAGVLQAVLVALQEELQIVAEKEKNTNCELHFVNFSFLPKN